MAKRKKYPQTSYEAGGGPGRGPSTSTSTGGGGGGGSTPDYTSIAATLGGAEVARSHRAATATVPLTSTPSPNAPVTGPSRTETKAYRRAARQQAAVIQKYALNNEESRLEKKHYEFDQQGRITKVKATRDQIHADLDHSRDNVKRTTAALFSTPRVHQANVKGKVLGPKKIERIDQRRLEPVKAHRQAIRERKNLLLKTGAVKSPAAAKEQAKYDVKAATPGTALHQAVSSKGGGGPISGSTQANPLGPLPQGIKTAGELATIAALPVPYVKGARILEALRAAKPGEALLSRAVKAAGERVLPKAATKAAGAGVRGFSKVPGFRGTAEGLATKPLRTAASTSLKGGLAAGTAMHPAQAGEIGGDIGEWLGDVQEYGKRFGDVATFFGRTPEALYRTAEELATSGEARRQTIFGARDLALGATAFPFLAGYEAITEGPGEALDTFTHSVKHDFKSAVGPALRGDWDTFQARMEREGLGGAAVPLSFLIPGAAVASRGGLILAKGGAKVIGGPEAEAALGARRPLRYGMGEKEVQHYPGGNRGLVGVLAHGGLDLVRAMAQSRREPGSKANLFPRKGESVPLFPEGPINKYRRGRHASRIPVEEDIAGSYRGRQLLQGRESLHKLISRNDRHKGLFSYAIELGVPKDAPSMIRALEAKLTDIQRNPSEHPSAGAEIADITNLIKQLKRDPSIVGHSFRRDAAKANDIVQYFEEQAGFLETPGGPSSLGSPRAPRMAQTEVRAYAEQAEQLAKRADSQLPSLEKALGGEEGLPLKGMPKNLMSWEANGRDYVRAVGKEAIDAEAQRQGLGQPGYFPAYEAKPRPISVTKSQTKRAITPQQSAGILARAGARDVSGFRLQETMQRLNRTINEIKSGKRAEDELARDPSEILSALEGKKVDATELRGKTAQEVTTRLAQAGLDLSRIQLFNAEALAKKFKVRYGKAAEAGKLERMDQQQINKQMDKLIGDVTISAEEALRGETPASLASGDKNWMIIGDAELTQFRGRFRPFGHLGEKPMAMAQIWTRAKTLASKYLLAHPSWFAFQTYANAYLAGIAEPGSLVATGYGKWLKSMTDLERQNFERAVGIPLHHPDVGTAGGSLVASWMGWNKGLKQGDFYQRHLAGKNPLDALFRGETSMEHFFKGKVLYTKARRQAYARMGNSMNRILTTMDRFTGGKFGKVEQYEAAMKELMADPKAVEQLAKDTSSFMGDYATFNAKERTWLANNVLFYGFIRHSLMLSLYTLPVKHPLRTGLIAQMGSMVNKEQKKMITSATKDWLREYMLHLGYSPERATFFSGQFKLENNSIPLSMLGSFYLSDGTVIDLKRASFAGSLPVETHAPWQLLAAFNPIGTFIFESFTGIDTYTGQPIQTSENYRYAPGFGRENPDTPGADTLWGDAGDYAKYAGISALQFFSPIRELSDAVSELPYNERTALSFPLPGPLNPFPEEQFIRGTAETKGRRAINKQIQYEAKHGWRSITPELFPFMPHETAAIPGLAMSWLYGIGKKSEKINAREDKAEKKKPEPQGYKATTLPGDEGSGYKDVLLPGEKPASEKEEETTYAESMYKVLKNVFDVKEAPKDDAGTRRDPARTGRSTKLSSNVKAPTKAQADKVKREDPRIQGPAERQAAKKLLASTQAGGGGVSPPVSKAKTRDIIGVPYSGTHTRGDWQSDNAIDIAMPNGTKIKAVEGGTVDKVYRSTADTSQATAGWQVTIGGKTFYTHLLTADVREGDQVQAGQVIGTSGAANGVEHLHMGVSEGDPRRYLDAQVQDAEPSTQSIAKARRVLGQAAVSDLLRPAQIKGPKERRVAERLTKAARQAQPTGGKPTGPLTPGQQTFGAEVAKLTGLSPRVVGAWMLQEDNGAAAQGYEDSNYHNWLNIGPFEQSPVYADPVTAAKRTAELINTSSNYEGIRAATQGSDQEQLDSIVASPWGTLAIGTYDQVGESGGGKGKPIPKGLQRQAEQVLGKQATQQILNPGQAAAGPGPAGTTTVGSNNRPVYEGTDIKPVKPKTLFKYVTNAQDDATVASQLQVPESDANLQITGLVPAMQRALVKLGKDTGIPVELNEGYRTAARAQDFPSGLGSEHYKGLAVDVGNMDAYTPEQYEAAGLTLPYPDDPAEFNHLQLANPEGTTTVPGETATTTGTTASTGTTSTTGTTAPSIPGTFTPPVPSMRPAKTPRSAAGFTQEKLLKLIGEDQGFNKLFGGEDAGAAPAEEDATMAAMAEIAATRKRLLRR